MVDRVMDDPISILEQKKTKKTQYVVLSAVDVRGTSLFPKSYSRACAFSNQVTVA